MINLKDLTFEELKTFLVENGEKLTGGWNK